MANMGAKRGGWSGGSVIGNPDNGTNGNNNGRNIKGNSNTLVMPAFMPGQLGSLATDLNAGFGGGVGDWKDSLRQVTAPMRIDMTPGHARNRGGNGGGKNNDGKGGKDDTGVNEPVFDPSSPRHRMAPSAAPMAIESQGVQQGLLSYPTVQQRAPTLGFLGNAPMGGAQFQLPPEIQAILARRR